MKDIRFGINRHIFIHQLNFIVQIRVAVIIVKQHIDTGGIDKSVEGLISFKNADGYAPERKVHAEHGRAVDRIDNDGDRRFVEFARFAGIILFIYKIVIDVSVGNPLY
jgi:hypothetical protein